MLNWITRLSSDVLHLSAHESLKRLNRLFKSTGVVVLSVILCVLYVEIDHNGVIFYMTPHVPHMEYVFHWGMREGRKKSIIIASSIWAVFISVSKHPWNLFDLIKSRFAQSTLKEKEQSCWFIPKPIICARDREFDCKWSRPTGVYSRRGCWQKQMNSEMYRSILSAHVQLGDGFTTHPTIHLATNQRICLESIGLKTTVSDL